MIEHDDMSPKLFLEIERVRVERGLTKRDFAAKAKFSEATFYRCLKEPVLFTDKQLLKLSSAFEELPFNFLKALQTELLIDDDVKIIDKPDHLIDSPFKTRLIYLLSSVVFVALIVITYLSIQLNALTPTYDRTIEYNGLGTDYSKDDLGKHPRIHDAYYDYQFNNIVISKDDSIADVKGTVTLTSKTDPQQVFEGNFSGGGIVIGDKIAITYTVTVKQSDFSWSGAMMLFAPSTGSAEGVWLTLHNDEPSNPVEKYAIGHLVLEQRITTRAN